MDDGGGGSVGPAGGSAGGSAGVRVEAERLADGRAIRFFSWARDAEWPVGGRGAPSADPSRDAHDADLMAAPDQAGTDRAGSVDPGHVDPGHVDPDHVDDRSRFPDVECQRRDSADTPGTPEAHR